MPPVWGARGCAILRSRRARLRPAEVGLAGAPAPAGPGLATLVHGFEPAAAYAISARFDVLACNRPARLLFGNLDPGLEASWPGGAGPPRFGTTRGVSSKSDVTCADVRMRGPGPEVNQWHGLLALAMIDDTDPRS